MEKINIKNVILSLLVAYVVIDLCCTVMLKHSRPLLCSEITSVKKRERRKMIGCIIVGLIAGGCVYYFTTF